MAGKKRSFRSLLKKILLVLNIIALLALFASYASLYIDPRRVWILAFFGLSYPIILTVNAFFVVAWLVLWKRYIFLSLVSILAGWNLLTTLIPVRISSLAKTGKEDLLIVTYNVHGFSYLKKPGETRADLYRYIESENPAIFCAQEYIPGRSDKGDSGIIRPTMKGMPHGWFKSYYDSRRKGPTSGLVTFSRYPVVGSGFLKDGQNRVYAIYSDIAYGGKTIRVYNVHLVSIRFGYDEYSFYDRLINQQGENLQVKKRLLKILGKLKNAFEVRSAQTERILGHIRTSPYPVVVCGDFNDSPFSYSYHQMTRGLRDAFRDAGSGFFGNTYSGELPAYRIDYVLFDKQFEARSYKTGKLELSDHYPVSVSLSIQPGRK